MQPHKYKFVDTGNATKWNTKLLKRDRYDLTKALAGQDDDMMEPSAGFRHKDTLQPLFYHYDEKLSEIISTGVSYPLSGTTEKNAKKIFNI